MKHQVYFGIALRIVALFVIGMLMTFVTPELREFFGDVYCESCGAFNIDSEYEWGARHYWYAWMMFFLFILSLINVIISIRNLILKHYPDI